MENPVTTVTASPVLLDDGKFYIERNVNFAPGAAAGFLLRRCATSLTTPGGYECIGWYKGDPGGKWAAYIDAPYNPLSDDEFVLLGKFDSCMDAISELWRRREEAFSRHP